MQGIIYKEMYAQGSHTSIATFLVYNAYNICIYSSMINCNYEITKATIVTSIQISFTDCLEIKILRINAYYMCCSITGI